MQTSNFGRLVQDCKYLHGLTCFLTGVWADESPVTQSGTGQKLHQVTTRLDTCWTHTEGLIYTHLAHLSGNVSSGVFYFDLF